MSHVQRSLRSAALIAAATLVLVAFLAPAVASAWTSPTVTPMCAPDADHYEFTVTLSGTESNYDFDWSLGTSGVWTTVTGHLGNNDLVVLRASGDLWVRWSSDHSITAHATPNGTLCASPSPSATSPVQSESIAPTESATASPTATPTATPTGSVLPTASTSASPSATTPVESESLPPSTAPSSSASPSGAVLGVTGAATITPPPTDTVAASAQSGDAWRVMFLALAVFLTVGFALAPSRRRR